MPILGSASAGRELRTRRWMEQGKGQGAGLRSRPTLRRHWTTLPRTQCGGGFTVPLFACGG
eukprot:2356148-Rhodomonas_salina.1